ncbi:MAG: HD domain-containing protein, partial [Candidatus Dormibacteria bacterium]
AKARRVVQAFDRADRDHLLAAAHLHDVGYAPSLRRTGAHQLDGAEYVRSFGHERLAGLVAHHSAARFELELRGLGDQLAGVPTERSDVTAALIYCDLTTGPTGTSMSLDERIDEVVGRYGSESVVAQALRRARPELAEAVESVGRLLSGGDVQLNVARDADES